MASSTKQNEGGIREMLNRKPWITIPAIAIVVLVIVFYFMRPEGQRGGIYYTNDDGKTFFRDSMLVPPFTKDGKETVLAIIYMCPDKKPFVGYLKRYTPEGKKQLEEELRRDDPRDATRPSSAAYEIKRPGDTKWIQAPIAGAQNKGIDAKAFGDILSVKCPGGSGQPEMVMPE